MISAEAYNAAFLKYPKLTDDRGWIHGVWYCGAFYKSKLYGDYPPTFLKRAMSLFPGADPPYSKQDAEKYGTPPFPLKRSFDEFRRVLAPGGYLGLLHFYYPPFRRANWDMRALIGVCTGSNRKMRMFAVFQKTNATTT